MKLIAHQCTHPVALAAALALFLGLALPTARGDAFLVAIAAGASPQAVAVNPVTGSVYVANYNDGTITVIDGASNATTAVTAGANPSAVAVNSITNKIYVPNSGAGSVTVLDGATNNTATIAVGANPVAVAVNPVTNKIYVANQSDGAVTVLDGATGAVAAASVGSKPTAIAVNPVTNQVYVANSGDGTVTVLDGVTNSTSTLTAGSSPQAIAVNPLTNKIYVANEGDGTVTVLDGVTNSSSTVSAGLSPLAIAVNPLTNKIYVANSGGGTVTVVDGVTNATSTVTAGLNPLAVAFNAATNKIYVANSGDGTVTVIDGANNAATAVAAGAKPLAVAVNPVTNRIYTANSGDGTVAEIDGDANTTAAVQTGASPQAVAVNPITNKIYVANHADNTVTVIDGATQETTTVNGGAGPVAVAVNVVTNKIYVADGSAPTVTVIDGVTNETTTVYMESGGIAIAVNPVTNDIYVANAASEGSTGFVTAIAGATNSAGAVNTGQIPAALAVDQAANLLYVACNYGAVIAIDGLSDSKDIALGIQSDAVAVNPVTGEIYVADVFESLVAVLDSEGNEVSGFNTGTPPVNGFSASTSPVAVAVNPTTNKVYVVNDSNGSAQSSVTIFDRSTSSTTTIPLETQASAVAVNSATNQIYVATYNDLATPGAVAVIDGITNSVAMVDVGIGPVAVAVNPVTAQVYVVNNGSNEVTVITPIAPRPSYLGVAIEPLPGDVVIGAAAEIRLAAVNGYAPSSPDVAQLYYQLDAVSGPWSTAAPAGSSGAAQLAGLSTGVHILYAYAGDSLSSTSINPGGSPIPGGISAYVFFCRNNFYSGSFLGEIVGPEVAHAGAVSISALPSGPFTATLNYGGVNYRLKGIFDSTGFYSTTIPRKGLPSLQVTLYPSAVNGGDVLVGNVMDDGTQYPIVTGKANYSKSNPPPQLGKYTILIPNGALTSGDSGPGGSGAATLNVLHTGAMTVVGTLADGTKFSQGTTLTRDGVWYMYLPLYAASGPSAGMIEGTITFASIPKVSDLAGDVTWVKPPNPKSSSYPGGFSMAAGLIGSAFTPSGSFIVGTASGQTFQAAGGNLASPLTEPVAAAAEAASYQVAGGDKLALNVAKSSGVITGGFVLPGTNTSATINAVVFQAQNLIEGNFICPKIKDSLAGNVLLTSP